MPALRPLHMARETKRLTGNGYDVPVEIGSQESLTLQQALVRDQASRRRGPPPTRVVAHPLMRTKTPHRLSTDDPARIGISERGDDFVAFVADVSQCDRAHRPSVPSRPSS